MIRQYNLIKDNCFLDIWGSQETAKHIYDIDIEYGKEYPVLVNDEVVYIATSFEECEQKKLELAEKYLNEGYKYFSSYGCGTVLLTGSKEYSELMIYTDGEKYYIHPWKINYIPPSPYEIRKNEQGEWETVEPIY